MRLNILIVLSLLGGIGVADDQGLTLSEAVKIASENSPELRQSNLAMHSAGLGRMEAISAHLPHIDLHGTHFLDAKYSELRVSLGGAIVEFPTAYPQSDFTFEASLLLFDGFGAINQFRAARLEYEAAKLELEDARFRLEENINVLFQKALAAQEFVKVAEQKIETLEQHLQLAQVNQKVGFSTNVDVLRIEALLEEARADKILAVDNVLIAKNELYQALGVEEDARPIVGTLLIPESTKAFEDLKLELSERRDVSAQVLREDKQYRLAAASKSEFFPRVTLFAAGQFYKYGDFDPAVLPSYHFYNAYSVGLRVSWNLFNGGGSIAKSKRAHDFAKSKVEQTRKLLIASPHEFELWKRKFIYNVALYSARKRAEEKSAESVRLATIAVKAGTKTHAEALDAEQELFRARAGVIQAQVGAAEALSKLEVALGHRVN